LSKTTPKLEQNYTKIGAKLQQKWSKTRPTIEQNYTNRLATPFLKV
jgi:hypothetical protein